MYLVKSNFTIGTDPNNNRANRVNFNDVIDVSNVLLPEDSSFDFVVTKSTIV